MTQKIKNPPDENQLDITIHPPPRIEIYKVTDWELEEIENGVGVDIRVSRDFAFMLTSLSVSISLVIALATGDFKGNTERFFELAIAIFVLLGIRTGWSWFCNRSESHAGKVIARIRSRKMDPEA